MRVNPTVWDNLAPINCTPMNRAPAELSPTLRKININTDTIDDMKSHPYIRYVLANAIVPYRNQHGNFTAMDDIKKVMLITEDVFNKLAPYIVVN